MGTEPEEWGHQAIYLGHGEWGTLDTEEMSPSKEIKPMNTLERLKSETEHQDLMIARLVWEKGYPNMFGARIPIKTAWNLERLEQLLKDYPDKQVIEGLKFGWPTGRLPTLGDPTKTFKNHKGALDHPEALKKYIQKEQEKGAILGPFSKIPFKSRVGISPISTRPKKQSQDRRVIIDLSFPHTKAVNDGMVKNNYLGFAAELTFPKTDDLARRIAELGENTMMFKIDLSRYFRQIPQTNPTGPRGLLPGRVHHRWTSIL